MTLLSQQEKRKDKVRKAMGPSRPRRERERKEERGRHMKWVVMVWYDRSESWRRQSGSA
jgi:hypothetical protein